MEIDRTDLQRELRRGNEIFRRTLQIDSDHKTILTASIADDPRLPEILLAVRTAPPTDKDNDPYGEADFGSITVDSARYFWKIDYLDRALTYGVDPYSTTHFVRVLTIMRADEY